MDWYTLSDYIAMLKRLVATGAMSWEDATRTVNKLIEQYSKAT